MQRQSPRRPLRLPPVNPLYAFAASLKWACFRWAGPVSPNLPPGTCRTWTLCSASSYTGQCWAGGPGKDRPQLPGLTARGGATFLGGSAGGGVLSEQPYLGFSCVWCSLRQGVGTCTPPFPELDAPDPLSLAAGTLVRRGTGLSTHLQKTPLSKEVKQN